MVSNWATSPRYVDAAGRKRLDDCTGNGPRGRCKGTGRRLLPGRQRAAGPLTRPRLYAPREGAGACSPCPMQPAAGPMQGNGPALDPGQTTARGSAHPAVLVCAAGRGRRLLTLPDATGRGSDAREGAGACPRAIARAAGPLTRPRLYAPRERAGACSPCPMQRAAGPMQGNGPALASGQTTARGRKKMGKGPFPLPVIVRPVC